MKIFHMMNFKIESLDLIFHFFEIENVDLIIPFRWDQKLLSELRPCQVVIGECVRRKMRRRQQKNDFTDPKPKVVSTIPALHLHRHPFSSHALRSNRPQQPLRKSPNTTRIMPIKGSTRPIRILLPLQSRQLLVKPRCDRGRGHAQLIRRVAVVDGEFGSRGCGDRAGSLQFEDLCDYGGFDGGVGKWDSVAEFDIFEAGDGGGGDGIQGGY